MTGKPSYAELEQKVVELESEIIKYRRREENIKAKLCVSFTGIAWTSCIHPLSQNDSFNSRFSINLIENRLS